MGREQLTGSMLAGAGWLAAGCYPRMLSPFSSSLSSHPSALCPPSNPHFPPLLSNLSLSRSRFLFSSKNSSENLPCHLCSRARFRFLLLYRRINSPSSLYLFGKLFNFVAVSSRELFLPFYRSREYFSNISSVFYYSFLRSLLRVVFFHFVARHSYFVPLVGFVALSSRHFEETLPRSDLVPT